MSRRDQQMAELARIARLQADLELRRYAGYRSHAEAMRRHVDDAREELAAAMAAPASDALDQWRLATALVGYRAGQLHQAEEALLRMKPALDAARAAAATAFGRAEAIAELRRLTARQEQEQKARRTS